MHGRLSNLEIQRQNFKPDLFESDQILIYWVPSSFFYGFSSGIPIIGWAKPTPVNPGNFANPRRDGMYVSGAGPVSNLLVRRYSLYSGILLLP
jgi:Zn-dependent protease